MAIIKVKEVYDFIDKPYMYSGSTSYIYNIGNNKYFKYFNEEYHSLRRQENRNMLNTLICLMNIKNSDSLILPIDIYVSRTKLLGYSMKKVNALPLSLINKNEEISTLVNRLLLLDKDIRYLADNHIDWDDVHNENILYKDKFYLLDFDLSLYREFISSEEIYKRIYFRIWYSILMTIFNNEELKILGLERLKYRVDNFDIIEYSSTLLIALNKLKYKRIDDIDRGRVLKYGYK